MFVFKIPTHPGFRIISPVADPWDQLWEAKTKVTENKLTESRWINGFKVTLSSSSSAMKTTHQLKFKVGQNICAHMRSKASNIHECFTSVHVTGRNNFDREWLTVVIYEQFEVA